GIAYGTTIQHAIGGGGNDTFIVNGANDTIDGGGGINTVVFSGARSSYTLTALAGNGVRVVGPDGTDTLSNIEKLTFADQTINWGTSSTPVAVSHDFNGDGFSDLLWQ